MILFKKKKKKKDDDDDDGGGGGGGDENLFPITARQRLESDWGLFCFTCHREYTYIHVLMRSVSTMGAIRQMLQKTTLNNNGFKIHYKPLIRYRIHLLN
jgi:hypothetical protein